MQSENCAYTNAGRVARSKSAWKASHFGCEHSDDDCDNLVGDDEGTACNQLRRSEWWSNSSDDEWSDKENEEILSELYSDDDYECPYELLTLEEALRHFYETKIVRLACGNHASLALPETSCKLMPFRETST